MRILLISFLFICSQTLSKAENIKEFEINGMSVGDSLLKYYSKNTIDNNKEFLYKSKKYFSLTFFNVDSDNYENIQFHFRKDDKDYIIDSISGEINFKKGVENRLKKYNMNCAELKAQIDEDVNSIFADISKRYSGEYEHAFDETGKSRVDTIEYQFDTGDIFRVMCTDWSKKLNKANPPYYDYISVSASLKRFVNFMNYEAYN